MIGVTERRIKPMTAPFVIDSRLTSALRQAKGVTVLTGAGVSAESGIPTFRDKQTGLWENFDAAELATPYAFERDPALVWGWYEWRRAAVLAAQPNAAHRAIAAMAEVVPQFTLITQNVDDLHERAGSLDVLHLHGELSRPYCKVCRRSYVLEGISRRSVGALKKKEAAEVRRVTLSSPTASTGWPRSDLTAIVNERRRVQATLSFFSRQRCSPGLAIPPRHESR